MYVTHSRDGTPIAVWKSGAGSPLLLVHGTTADHTRWARIAPVFEQSRTVLAMDRRGRGGSGDAAEYAIAREAEDVAAVIDGEARPVDVMGHSYGAICSLEASLLTSRIRSLVLYEPPLPVGEVVSPPQVMARIQKALDSGDPEAAVVLFFQEVVGVAHDELDVLRRHPAWKMRVSAAQTLTREMRVEHAYVFDRDRFRNVDTPVLLLLGGESEPAFVKATEVLAAALPRSRTAILPGQKHVAMDTAPELFAREVLAFLDDPSSGVPGAS